MSGTLAIGFSAIAKTYVSVPALCIGNSIAAGCTGGLSCFMFVCAVRHYTCMQIAQEQQNGRLLVPSQQSMILSPDSGQERVGFSPISDVTS